MAAKKKATKKTAAKKGVTKKRAPKKKAAVKKKAVAKDATVVEEKSKAVVSAELAGLDQKGLAARAREIKRELLAIRFNMQSPSLAEYRKKKKELSKVLGHMS